MLSLCPGPCHVTDLYHHGWITKLKLNQKFRASCISEPSVRLEELKKDSEDKYSPREEDEVDGAVTNVAIRRRVQAGSENSLGSLSLSSFSRLNPVEQASGWNKLNLVKVLVLCVEMIMLVKVTRLTKHWLMYHDLRWAALSVSPPWCWSLCSGTGPCPCLTAGPRSSTGWSSSVSGECDTWHVTWHDIMILISVSTGSFSWPQGCGGGSAGGTLPEPPSRGWRTRRTSRTWMT